MAVFYQQSGRRGEADFAKTISAANGALRFFTAMQLRDQFGFEVAPEAVHSMSAGAGFQIWGVPSGAGAVIAGLQPGDVVLLIGLLSRNALDFARFYYAGRVTYIVPEEEFALSASLWGEGGFPLIFFMQGALINYPWREFTTDFGYAPNYYVAGHTMRLKPERLEASRFHDTEGFATRLGIDVDRLRVTHGPIAEQLDFEEGDRRLKSHLAIERSSALIRKFKESLTDLRCSICRFDFEAKYGPIGKAYIEAHHITPLAQEGQRSTSVADLIAVCANCHRMLHRQWPANTVAAVCAAVQLSETLSI